MRGPSSANATSTDIRVALEELHVASFAWAMACTHRRRSTAEDVLQTAYLAVISGKAVFHGRSSFKTWLFGVIRNTARSQLRRARWWPFGESDEAEAKERPSRDVVEREEVRMIAAALAELPERQREIVHLVFYQDLSLDDAAHVLGVSRGSASTHYDRGKKRLAALLRAKGIER